MSYDKGGVLSGAGSLMASAMTKVYVWMMIALLVTAGVALYTVSSPQLLQVIFGNSIVMWGLFIVEIALVVWLSAGLNNMKQSTAILLFLVYAALNGLVLSSIFFAYEIGAIYSAFAASALTFGAMSVVGAVTKRDLSGLGGLLFMGLIGIIIASVINMFWANDTLDSIITYIGVFIFVGLTAYDTQKIKQMVSMADSNSIGKVAIFGALSLYLDFINLFLYILRLFGRSRD
ncbi:MAG: Bax inhibitor-1/YccA family protein [Bacteroidaceae bacterium]|nr:Bax inhibitor-1/YccA family protein [Bacteroidaceae bacterium]